MASFSSLVATFAQSPTTCGDLVSQAKGYLVRLRNCDREPSTFTVTFSSAVAIGVNTVDLELTAPVTVPATQIFLKKGFRIYRASGVAPYNEYVQLAQDLTLVQGTPATGVAVETTLSVIAANATAQVLEVLPVTAARNMPLDYQVKTDDTKRTSDGFKGNMNVVGISPSITTELFYDLADASIWAEGYIFDSLGQGKEVYVIRYSSGGEGFIAGAAKITQFSETDEVDATAKLSTKLDFQSNWYAAKPYRYLSLSEKAAANEIRRNLGLSQYV
jgi:hypothetical protein